MNVQEPGVPGGLDEGAELAPTGIDSGLDPSASSDEADDQPDTEEADVHRRRRVRADQRKNGRSAGDISADGISPVALPRGNSQRAAKANRDHDELQIRKALDRSKGNLTRAAKVLGFSRISLRERLATHKKRTGEDILQAYKATPFKQSAEDRLKVKLAKIRRDKFNEAKMPYISGTECLASIIRLLPYGREEFLEMVKMAKLNGYDSAKAWWDIYDHLTKDEQSKVNIDDVLVAANVRPEDLMAVLVHSRMQYGRDCSSLVAIALMPEIVAKAGESALRVEGYYSETQLNIGHRDRTTMFQQAGMLPKTNGPTVNVNANASASAQAAAATAVEPTVPRFADDMGGLRKVQERVQTQIDAEQAKMLPFPLVKEAELVE